MQQQVTLNWQGEFVSPICEKQFQAAKWPLNTNRAKLVCGLTALIYLAAAHADYMVLGLTRSFYILLAMRVLSALVGLANFLLAFRKEPFPLYAYTVAAYMVMLAISESVDAVVKSRALDEQMIPYTVIIILTFYVFLPIRTYPTFVAALFGSMVYALTLFFSTTMPAADVFNVVLFLIVVNAFGLYFLVSFSSSQRSEFFAFTEEKRLNEELKNEVERRRQVEAKQQQLIDSLKRAMDEVKTLRGFIPICASCKKIRDDEGYWKQIEVYIQEHSSATFSHGICPDCARKLYPEFFKK